MTIYLDGASLIIGSIAGFLFAFTLVGFTWMLGGIAGTGRMITKTDKLQWEAIEAIRKGEDWKVEFKH
jgi:hypothetical protein